MNHAIRYFVLYNTSNLNYLNRIDILWMSKIEFVFFFLAKYSKRASMRNTYYIHKIILVRDEITQIHTISSTNYYAMVRSATRSAFLGLYTTSLLVVVQ